MANRLYLQVHGSKTVFDFPLIEDINIETASQFQTWGGLVPSLDAGTDMVNNMAAAAGTIRNEFITFKNMFDLPRWTKTDPIKFTTKLSFYTKTDPKKDVFDKMKYIMSLSILTKNSNQTFTVPGIGARNIGDMLSQGKDAEVNSLYKAAQKSENQYGTAKETFDYKSKIISLEIPGVIYLNYAFITTCQPIISKQKTEKGYPLWGEMNITFSGLFPASDQIFSNTEIAVTQFKSPTTSTSSQSNLPLQKGAVIGGVPL
jgi:hypothetical protein